METSTANDLEERPLLIQIASYNTNLQGLQGVPQDLVDWISPTFRVSSFLSRETHAPDIVAVGFQELLPLHLGLLGLSAPVLDGRADHILKEIEKHAPNGERYSLVGKVVSGCVALLVYARDDGIARKIVDVQTQWTTCGPGWMSNKGAVGLRFRVPSPNAGPGETYTFVCAHLTAHAHKLDSRISDYKHIVSSLLFPPPPGSSESSAPTTMYSTSHLFFFGDLNFRIVLPENHDLSADIKEYGLPQVLDSQVNREKLKEYDQLTIEKRKGTILQGLYEGDFWKFKCSYKYKIGEVDRYSTLRTPSWTDRVLYATHTDSPQNSENSQIRNILYTSIPSYTTSDHKPIVTLLLVPQSNPAQTSPDGKPPVLQLPEVFSPQLGSNLTLKRYIGLTLDRTVGILWTMLIWLGFGWAAVGLFGYLVFWAAPSSD